MQTPNISHRGRMLGLFALLGVFCLSGANCGGGSSPDRVAPNNVSAIKGTSSATVVSGSGATAPLSSTPQTPISDLVNAINQLRSSNGLSTLTYDGGLAAAAQLHTDDMVNQQYFALVNPQGIDVFTRYVSSTFAVRTFTAGQYLIAQGTTSGSSLFNALEGNAASDAVLLNPAWVYVGAGYNGGFNGTWTVFFSN